VRGSQKTVKNLEQVKKRNSKLERAQRRAVILCVVLACLSTCLLYHDFGTEDQKSELPLILRAIDPGYLPNDFYTNSASEYHPRYFYAKFISLISNETSLPWVVFILTLLVNITISLVTYAMAMDFFGDCPATGLLASGLVMSVHLFRLGYHEHIVARQLLSSTLAFAFIALSFWMAFRARPYICALSGGLAALIHPTFGTESGLLAFFVLVGSRYNRSEYQRKVRMFIKKEGWRILGALCFMLVFLAIPTLHYLVSPQIDSEQFIDIETRFRHPHHSLARYLNGWDLAFASLISFGFAWHFCSKRTQAEKHHLYTILWLSVALLFLCLLGLFFTEVIPLRIWAIARPFRLLFLLKWLGLILIAGFIADVVLGRHTILKSFEALYIIPSLLFPLSMVFSVTAASIRSRLRPKSPRKINQLSPLIPFILAVAICAYLFILRQPRWPIVLAFAVAVGLWLFFLAKPSAPVFTGVSTVMIGICLIPVLLYLPANPFPDKILSPFNFISPKIKFADMKGFLPEVSEFAKENTEEDSLFLTPPEFGLFRLMAKRAIVVNWKSFPFQDYAMVEWKNRMDNCYGQTKERGHKVRRKMAERYHHIRDKKILALYSDYGFSYCVLFADTATQFPVLYENKRYKIISLTE